MECLGVFHAVLASQFPVARQEELLDVVAIRGGVVVAQQRQAPATPGQFGSQLRSVMPRRPFRHVGAVGLHLLVHHAADVHHARDLRPPRVVVLVADLAGLEPGRQLLGIVVRPAGDPARRLDGAGQRVVIGILLVVRPRVETNDRIHLQQADEKNQPAHQFVLRDAGHVVIVVVQVEIAFEAQNGDQRGVVALVAQHVLADGAGRAESGGVAHVVVGGANQVARVTLPDEFGHRARGGKRDVVRVRLDGQQHLAFVRHARGRPLEKDPGRGLLRRGPFELRKRGACHHVGEEVAS